MFIIHMLFKFNNDTFFVSGLQAFLAIILKKEYRHSFIIINAFNAPGWLGMVLQTISFSSVLNLFKEYNLTSDNEPKTGECEIKSCIIIYLVYIVKLSEFFVIVALLKNKY